MEFEQTTSPCPDVVRDEVRWLVAKYSFALLCVTLATWIRLELAEILGDRMPFGTYFLAVFIAAWLGGAGPGLLCLAGSIVAAAHFIVEPANSLFISEPAPLLSLLVFGLVGTVTILLFHGLARKSELASESFRRIELLNQRLTAADRAKDEFISVLAHELRNPLAPMQSAAELLQHPAVSPAQVAATGKLYARHLAHMRHLVDDLFHVSRYLRGQLNLQWEIVDLRQPIGNAVEFINAALEEKSLVLKILLPPEPLMLRVDPVRITQAVANLLVNAVKFTPHGGSITLLVERSGNEAKIMVKDSGIGIDPSMHNMIFEPFNQVVPGRARLNGGLGLGLTLVKKVIELHGGKVAVASAGLGRGSCFTISLPILHQPTPELPPAA
ncbi:MAG: HAMP domain-containing histidine kinase, partial [Planctomycetales bacterium]|nr:HAMP domain-containing histidine kinase [Planctomycetales bacterium]